MISARFSIFLACVAPLFGAILLAPSSAAQVSPEPGDPADQKPKPKVLGVDVTFLANEGFFLESGRYSVLIDAFLREPAEPYAALPSEVHKKLVNALPPFDGLTVVLVSHNHPDHVQMRGLEKYLGRNNQAQLMTSPQVCAELRESAQDFDAISRRVTPVPVSRSAPNKLMQEEMTVEFLPLAHGGKNNEGIMNLGHLIEMGGLKILHVGDAEPAVEHFEGYDLDSRGIDIAFVPYWFFGSAGGARVLNEKIKARIVVACHVPPNEWAKLNQLLEAEFPGVVMFKDALEKKSFQPLGAPPAAAAGEEGG